MADAIYLGVSVDESFAEFSLLANSPTKTSSKNPAKMPVLKSQRIYLARESLKTSLASFLSTSESKPQKVFVSLRFLEKILDYRLGGSVAQLVSDGFENWAQIRSRQPAQQNLSNPDLVFAVRERVSGDGQVLEEINIEDLELIEAKLKMMEVKRVCLNFLHSSLQPHNLKKAQDFFSARDFDVFVPPASDNKDEVSRWRANTLNASISGTFLELKEQIEEGCKEFLSPESIYYLSAQKKVFQNEKQARLGSLFSTRTAIIDGQTSPGVLYLGLEKFSWLTQETENFWKSPWGLVELEHPACVDLRIQPTSLIDLNIFGELDFTTKVEGYEPGPMCMGRGQKPTLLDLYAEDETLKTNLGLGERISATGTQRFKSTLQALAKITKNSKSVEKEKLIAQLKELALQRLALEVNLQPAVAKGSPVKVMGPLAAVLGPGLKKQFPAWEVDFENFEDSCAVALAGQRWKAEAP